MKIIITDLRAELEVSRLKVTKAESDLAKVREEAKEYVRGRVEAAAEILVKARRELNEYVAEIAKALGLSNPAAAREGRARTKLLRKLVREGKSVADAALEVQISSDEAEQILAPRSGEKTEPAEGDRGWKRARVLQLLKEGRTTEEISDLMAISLSATRSHFHALVAQGKWNVRSVEEDEGVDGPDEVSDEAEDKSEEVSGAISEPGDSVEVLKAEVARQQGPQRSKAVRLVTVGGDGRQHAAIVDRFGDGRTVPDDSGSIHRIYRFVVNQDAAHTHSLKAPGGSERAGS
jgi:hypothetical protein